MARPPSSPATHGGMSNGGVVVTHAPMVEQRVRCRPGYVAVTDPNTGYKMCMLKEVARSCGLWKARPKPVLTASDRKTLRKAESIMDNKVARVVQMTNNVRGKAKYTRSTGRKK